jgi:coproporphyrinogen III oxidase
MNKEQIQKAFENLQVSITKSLESADGSQTFFLDEWQRDEGGGGKTMVFRNGRIIEKGCVNFSAVYGPTPDKILRALKLEPADFFATGVSIVMHPFNPMVPIIHMNVRYFEMSNGTYWFGGGIDLTPHFVDPKDATYFHKALKEVCDRHHHTFYPKFKQWADEYFYIKHRRETRGIGGIFFDRLEEKGTQMTKSEVFYFVSDVGNTFAPIYNHLMKKNADLPYTEKEKQWQKLRRGRYVEFNLVLDKGTKFGLDTDGRTESILLSLPPEACWEYDFKPSTGSKAEKTLQMLKKGINWAEL